jgi:hypothetical protein
MGGVPRGEEGGIDQSRPIYANWKLDRLLYHPAGIALCKLCQAVMKGALYKFGPFRLDVKERRLLRDGQPVQSRAKVFEASAWARTVALSPNPT